MTVTERLVDGVVVLMVVGRMTVETRDSALTRLVNAAWRMARRRLW